MMLAILVIDRLYMAYVLMLFGRILGSWLPELQQYKFMHFISYYTDPYLNLFRRIIPPLGMIDISPIVAFISLGFIKSFLISLIVTLFR